MALNKLDNFIKNTEGRILYVNPNDLDATDAITNQGNSLAQPFKTVQRALLEAARFSYLQGSNNDVTEKTTILLFPGIHTIDNRPGFALKKSGTTPYVVSPSGTETIASETLSLTLSSNFDITQLDNILYKFNSINGGVIVPRGTSIVGLDLRKTKLRPKYVPNPTDSTPTSAIFRITGACYFWQFSLFDADESGKVYTNKSDFSEINKATPTFSHHKLTCFEYVDGVNIPPGYDITDLDMYYGKVSNAFRTASGRDIDQKYPVNSLGFSKQRPEWEIVGAFATDPISIGKIISGDGIAASTIVTVTTSTPHNLTAGTPIKINKVDITYYNISTKVQNVLSSTQFTYLIPENYPINLDASPTAPNGTVTIETDTVGGASPYIFNISLRSVWGMNGMHADGSKAAGFKSMVVAQFTGVSLQKDDRAFVKYNPTSRDYKGIIYSAAYGADLTSGSTSTDINSAYHLDSGAVYRNGWETFHIKMSNDAFIQIVSVFAIGYTSHFKGESGADASITNSNSNFGQNSLAATGFKKEAFAKDNTAYITSIIAPRAITSPETDIDWISLDVGITTQVGISSHLYLYGFSASDDIPPNILQGYRVGAKNNEILYANIGSGTSTASIYMCDKITSGIATGTNSSEKSYSVTGSPTNNKFTIGNHALVSGEKIRILSTSGDLPENITENTAYYAITSDLNATRTDSIILSASEIQLATSSTNAALASAISVYLGTDLKIVSRVSDKNPGDIGSPIQYDNTIKNWFVHTNTNSEIYRAIDTAGTSVLGARTNVSYIKRTSDSRSIDEKIYKLRVVVPKESVNSRDPLEGFVIQESSSTGIGSDAYATTPTISASDLNYNKNPRFISTCSTVGTTITVISELPHNLNANDIIIVKNVTDDTATTTGADNIGYNGTFSVTSIANDKTFTYSTTDVLGVVHSTGTFTNNTSSRTTSLPRFQRSDLQSNYYIYRSEIISQYKSGVSDGIYYLYALNAKNAVPTEFTSSKYNQNVVNLYPQLDRDNINENPIPTKTFAKRAPLGDVGTSDIKGSLTRETVDSFLQDFGLGLDVDSVTDAGTSATITFKREHGLSGIVTYSTLTGGSAKTPGTYYNVKLLNTDLTTWNGATAKVIVSSGQVTSATIQSKGSGYGSTTLYFDTTKIGGTADATITVATSGITTNIGDVIQFTGSATTSTSYYRITSVPSPTSISIAKTAGDPVITTSQYGFVVAPSTKINSSVYYPTTGITSFTCAGPHGLLAGNRFNLIDSNNNNLGDYLVATKVGINTFNAITNNSTISGSYVLKHGMSSNEAVADVTGENIGVRDFSFYDNDILKLVAFDSSNDTLIQVSSPISGISTSQRFPLGSYIQVDGEIMRVVSSTLNGYDQISVIRGVLGTIKASHDPGSIIKKIKPIPIELRRPTILRASNQTFEYLGYGPGNYSTGLPQVQVRTLTEKEAYLAQSQQKSCGTVVYTGMNNDGDFYIGNKKLSSKTGQEVVFDAPIPTITGQDASRLSVVYDEVTIKERVLVEGGNSGTILSQFDGPVTFNKETKFNATVTNTAQLKVINTTQSTDTLNGAVIVSGGVGIAKNLNIGGTLAVTDDTTFNKNVTLVGSNSVATEYFKIQNASAADKFTVDSSSGNTNISGILSVTGTINATTPNPAGTSGGVRIAANSSNNSYLQFVSSDRNTEYGLIVGTASSVTIQSSNGSLVALNDNTEIYGTLNVTGDITAFFTSDQRLKENIVPIVNPLAKVLSISGNTFDWVQGAGKEGSDVGVLAQEVLKVLPEAVTTRETGYLAVRYEKIIPLLIEAIKDLSAKVEDLQDQINNK